MGTNGGGLAKFDGLEFTVYTSRDGLKGNYIQSLYEDHNGTLWIGSTNGLSSFNNQNLKALHLFTEKVAISAITEDKQHRLWLGTSNGLYRLSNDKLDTIQPELFSKKGSTIHFVEKGLNGSIWVGTNKGTYVLNDTVIRHIDSKAGLSSPLSQSMGFDTSGNVWIGSYGSGLDLITSEGVFSMNAPTKLAGTSIFAVLCDKKGYIWLATQERGICKFNPKDSSTVFLSEKDNLANNHVRALLNDRWGNYWIGTSGGGVSKYSGQQFERYGKGTGLTGNYIYSISSGLQNSLWIGVSGGGISQYDGNTFTHFGSDSGFVDEKIRTSFVDSDSLLWMGIDGKGLGLFDRDTFHFFDVKDGLAGNFVKSIVEDAKGNLWVASAGGGITKLVKGDSLFPLKLKKYTINSGLPSSRVLQLHIDLKDRVWFATQTAGIGFIEQDSIITTFTKAEGLISNSIRSLVEDGFGTLWIGSIGGLNALKIYSDQIETKVIDANSLSSTNIYQLTIDDKNNLWVGTEKGLDRLTIDSSQTVLESSHFGSDEGFSGVETNLNASCLDHSKNLWFGTVNGLFRYLDQGEMKNTIAPILNFKEISINYIPIQNTPHDSLWSGGHDLQLEYDENHFTFDFLGITQTIPAKVKYKWKLVGLEDEWSPTAKRNSVTYSNLPPGNYTFIVLSANENEVWNDRPLEFKFEILAPVWDQGWFRIMASLLILLVLVVVITGFIRSAKRKTRRKQQQLKMERDLIGLEQKALRLQMNPHFIFHTLNNIQALISTKDEGTARLYLSKFSKLMRQILENSRNNEINLETEIETLENYLSIERFCHDNQFDYTIELSDGLETEFIQIPPMILQPFVENAIIHGVAPLKEQGMIKVSFEEKDQFLLCTITDNGIGRTEAAKRGPSDHKSTALEVTRERLSLLDPGSDAVVIEDLKKGTQVKIQLALRS